jgi:hypothetical protein
MTPRRLRFGSCVMRLASGAGRTSIGCYVIRMWFISLGSTGCMRFPFGSSEEIARTRSAVLESPLFLDQLLGPAPICFLGWWGRVFEKRKKPAQRFSPNAGGVKLKRDLKLPVERLAKASRQRLGS